MLTSAAPSTSNINGRLRCHHHLKAEEVMRSARLKSWGESCGCIGLVASAWRGWNASNRSVTHEKARREAGQFTDIAIKVWLRGQDLNL